MRILFVFLFAGLDRRGRRSLHLQTWDFLVGGGVYDDPFALVAVCKINLVGKGFVLGILLQIVCKDADDFVSG